MTGQLQDVYGLGGDVTLAAPADTPGSYLVGRELPFRRFSVTLMRNSGRTRPPAFQLSRPSKTTGTPAPAFRRLSFCSLHQLTLYFHCGRGLGCRWEAGDAPVFLAIDSQA